MVDIVHIERSLATVRKEGRPDLGRKRVLLVSTTSTVAYAFILPYAKYLKERGYEVSFACSTEDFSDARSRSLELREAGFEVHSIPFSRWISPYRDLYALCKLITLIRNQRYDVVHTHSSIAGFVGRLAARMAGCPRVVHTAYDFYFREFGSRARRWPYLTLEKLAARLCDVMLFISGVVREEAIRCRIKGEGQLILVGFGIEPERFLRFCADVASLRGKLGVGENDRLVGTVGRLVANKGTDTFLRMAAMVVRECPETKFIVAGDGPLRGELEHLARSLRIAERVKFVGYLPEVDDVMRFMSSLDVFVLPTRREGLGVVYLEAMALGRPVVGSRIAPVTEVIKEDETGLLATVDDPADFARAVVKLLRDPEGAKRMGGEGREHVRKSYDIRATFEKTEAVYWDG